MVTRDIPRTGLGTNRLRHTTQNVAFVRAAIDAGVRMVDTAHLYTQGESEATIGDALSPPPEGCYRGDQRRLRRRTAWIPKRQSKRASGPQEFVARGRIRDVGISEVSVAQIERARRVLPIVAVQNSYSLAERKHDDVVDYCASEGILFVPFFPLTGADEPRVHAIAARHKATPTQIALAWLLRRSPSMLPIPGTLSLAHVKENVAAASIRLSDAEFEALR